MKKFFKLQDGFTYLELIVVVSLFSIIATVIAGIFVLYNTAQTKAKITEEIVSNGRYIQEVIVREIRMGKIDYDSYTTPISNPKTILYLKDPDENIIIFERVSTGCAQGVEYCLSVTKGGNTAILSSDKINIEYLTFYLNPSEDPDELISGVYSANEQPLTTISLELKSIEDTTINSIIQTSASSKRYSR